jgi:NagD protein
MDPSLNAIRGKRAFICDMDGVLYHGNKLLPGTQEFIAWLKEHEKRFLFLTNSSERSPRDLKNKLARLGIEVGEEAFYTSALATASFLATQRPSGSVYVIGEPGLVNALYGAGFSMNDVNPDYVVVGETKSYNYEKICHAVNLVLAGAKLICTNPDITGPVEYGIVPAAKALVAPIEIATGKRAYFVGKPNALMMRHALKVVACAREETIIVGDRMDTDIRAGIEAEIDTLLVLSGVTARDDLQRFAYQPRYILSGVGEIARY